METMGYDTHGNLAYKTETTYGTGNSTQVVVSSDSYHANYFGGHLYYHVY
jgi:hypothetical protein